MSIWFILLVNMIIGFIAFMWDCTYCYERNGGKYNYELHARAYDVDSKVGSWWRSKLGTIPGNVIGCLLMFNAWFIWIPIHRIMIKKLFEKKRRES